ncbi:MAG TPA: hypothetical protein VK165_07545, partial [Azonexus sp.]|nr:hypothetical protein [Azonexus sp.]
MEFGSRRFATVDEAEREALGLLNGYHLEEAEGLARAILATDRTRPVAAAVLGIALYRNGRPVEALVPLARAAALAPSI